jgi:hypothetical protein
MQIRGFQNRKRTVKETAKLKAVIKEKFHKFNCYLL